MSTPKAKCEVGLYQNNQVQFTKTGSSVKILTNKKV